MPFYFMARLNGRDQHHELVVTFARNLRARLITTDWVLMEVADALAKSECRHRVREFILRLQQAPGTEVVAASRELLDRALELYHQHADKEWTLTDCATHSKSASCALMNADSGVMGRLRRAVCGCVLNSSAALRSISRRAGSSAASAWPISATSTSPSSRPTLCRSPAAAKRAGGSTALLHRRRRVERLG